MDKPEQTLRETLEKVAKEYGYENYHIIQKAISTEGANYTTVLYQASIKAPEKEELKLFAKVAAVGENMRAVTPLKMFETESLFYNKLNEKYKELEDKYDVPAEHRFVTPKFYGESKEYLKETLVFEDLTAQGFTTHDRFVSIDWEYASKGLENLAKFHALSFAFSAYDPDGFKEMAVLKGRRDVDAALAYFKKVVTNATQVTKEANRERFSKFMNELIDSRDIDRFYGHRTRPVIIHGDYRPSNLMHRILDHGMEMVTVDYQTLEMANPIIDILFFIFVGSDKNFRDRHFHQSLNHYYDELSKALKRFRLNPQEVYAREDFDADFKEILPVGLLLSVFCLLIVTVQKEDVPVMKEVVDIEDFSIDPNVMYTERLNDVIDDYINMGVI
ncbi:ecdysteroid 22-kinase [Danaus plexippus plexippus]|uniref:Ecdysteroid 22-kinase n=1 Tax=Danaus plexippus plexippus TaxID=278856 RepID=A0A212F2J2_DANPL|nr:ecdysteroid 22-kinase [Danaus plexippus plexippus]